MRNPFVGELIPYDYDLALLDRGMDLDDLESIFQERTILNTRYISPRGTGKSSLLDAFFTPEKCQELASQHKLVYVCRISGDDMPTDAKVFVWLIEAVWNALENLDPDSQEYDRIIAEMQKLKDKKPGYDLDANKGEALLKAMLQYLTKRRYSVTLILDEFHQLACARHLADSTFGKMATLGQNKLISYIIAADFDDSVGSDTFYVSQFSRIFSGDPVHLKGVTTSKGKAALTALIRSKLARYEGITFSDEELEQIYHLTGGIPEMVRSAVKVLFDVKQEMPGTLSPEHIQCYTLSACTKMMEKWVQHFDNDSWETMKAVLDGVTESNIKAILPKAVKDKRPVLGEAGLISKQTITQKYSPICPLFAQYIRQEYPRHCFAPTDELGLGIPGLRSDQIQKLVVNVNMNDCNVFKGDIQGGVNTIQNHLHQGIGISEILSLMEAGRGKTQEQFAASLANQLRGRLPAEGIRSLSPGDFDTQEAYELAYDEAFTKYSQNLVEDIPVDEDQKLMLSQSQVESMEDRFAQARKRHRSNLTDQMLAAQSERCRFYLKLSVIVEDALELPGLQMEDYSPQLVLYGKALEQSLTDHFYPLFHREETLSVYDTYEDEINPDSEHIFKKITPNCATIGSYEFVIRKQRNYLADLCKSYAPQASADTAKWWKSLWEDIKKARLIRNKADHADSLSPTREDLDKMCCYLMGTCDKDGILERNLVGTELFMTMFSGSADCEGVPENAKV